VAYRNVVVGTDGSETAEAAVREAARLAAACGARVTVVTAFTPHPAATARAREEAPEELQWMISDANAADQRATHGREIARQAGASEVVTRVDSGDPADIILRAAEDTGGDLIVVGSKGMSSPSRFLLGNVPNKVSHHAPCDVLIVHTSAR